MASKHEIIGLKVQGDKKHVDENVSDHGIVFVLHSNKKTKID